MKLTAIYLTYLFVILLMMGCATPAEQIYAQLDENFNTEGVTISAEEISRTQTSSDEIVKYRVLTKGLAVDKRYTLYIFREESASETLFERYQVSKSGELFSYDNGQSYHEVTLSLCEKHICGKHVDIIINSTDGTIRGHTKITPFNLATN